MDDHNDLFADQNRDTEIDGSDDRHVVHQIDLDLHCAGADNYNFTYSYGLLTKQNKTKEEGKHTNRISFFRSKQFCYEIVVLSVSPFNIYVREMHPTPTQ